MSIEREPRSRMVREGCSLIFWVIAFFLLACGVICTLRLNSFQRDSVTTEASIVTWTGLPPFMYEFTVNEQKFSGFWSGADLPPHHTGDRIPVTYLRSDPRRNSYGKSLGPGPIEDPRGYYLLGGFATVLGVYYLLIAKAAPKEYPWS